MVRRGQYQPTFSEASANPKFRPSIDMLITKLRKLGPLQNKPEAVEFVIEDLLHYYFIREAKRPDNLWHIAMSAVFKWQMALGVARGEDLNRVMVTSTSGGFATGGNEEAALGYLPPSPALSSPSPSPEAGVDLKDPALKKGVEGLLTAHMSLTGEHCTCGRSYPKRSAWAEHVRIRLWNYIKNDFPNRETTNE